MCGNFIVYILQWSFLCKMTHDVDLLVVFIEVCDKNNWFKIFLQNNIEELFVLKM